MNVFGDISNASLVLYIPMEFVLLASRVQVCFYFVSTAFQQIKSVYEFSIQYKTDIVCEPSFVT